ncbi:MAG: bifunctional folylpolyglutamate synthase/dihydrofolate synthase, partial [Limisphaerales bacterium]
MTYQAAIQYLYGLRLFGAKLGLENTRKLAALAGHPERRLRFIHLAGTNGKGSTCAMLESIYRQAGLRTGLFVSPHLVSFRERIQIGRELISERDVVRWVEKFQALLAEFPDDQHPTFFEVVTVMALDFFAEKRCDLVIWETGLGGRLDATNIVTPLACAITNIALDHQQWLGDTLEKIAFEKAGILKPGIPVATAADEPEALNVIRNVANQKKAPLT